MSLPVLFPKVLYLVKGMIDSKELRGEPDIKNLIVNGGEELLEESSVSLLTTIDSSASGSTLPSSWLALVLGNCLLPFCWIMTSAHIAITTGILDDIIFGFLLTLS